MVGEKVHDANPPRHLQPRLNLHCGPAGSGAGAAQPAEPISESGPHWVLDHPGNPIGIGDRERLDGEVGGHELGLTRFDLAGGYEHEPDLAAGVEELEGAVVVVEGCPVGIADGDVLGEGEADGGVLGGEGRELDGGDGDFGVFGFEDGEVDDEDDDDDED
ncbi:unnamed protein product [Malus baccata var. baccata]